jgi:hypothetical protein
VRRSTILAVVAAGGVATIPAACNNPTSHVYVAQLYEAASCCLDPNTELDIIPTGAAGLTCAPTCLATMPPHDGTPQIYVSTMCGPYPNNFDTSGTNAECVGALAAFAASSSCTPPPTSLCSGGDSGAGDAATTEASGGPSDAATADELVGDGPVSQ